MRIVVVAVGRLRPPFADDVQHYQRLLAGHAKVELVELKEHDKVDLRVTREEALVVLHVVCERRT